MKRIAATFAALALSLGLNASPATASYGSVYLYETVSTYYPYENSYRRFLLAGPFEDYSECSDYLQHIPRTYEQGIVRTYSCSY